MIAETTTNISRRVRALATPKLQRISAIATEPIADSSNVTPIVIAKLIARIFIGHDITISTNYSAARRKVERPIPLQPGLAPAPGTLAAFADLSRDAIARKT